MSTYPLRLSLTYVLASSFISIIAAIGVTALILLTSELLLDMPSALHVLDLLPLIVVSGMIIISYRRYYPDGWLPAAGLFWPQQSQRFWGGVGVGLVLFIVADRLLPLSEQDVQFHLDLIREIPLPLLVFSVVIMAPIAEELLFRQYLWQGLQHRWMKPLPATLLVNLLWAVTHLQYSLVIMAALFVYGCWLSWLRWHTGSLLLPMALHAVNNLITLFLYWNYV